MSKPIEYYFGQKIGTCWYMWDVDPHIPISGGKSRRMAAFKCACGKVFESNIQSIKRGLTKSCGCIKRIRPNRTTHGLKHHPFYRKWKSIKERCFNKNVHQYKDYGGRGITICDEWRNNPAAFIDYISKLKHAGDPGYTLDRINNDGDYEPGNVRWATAKQQRHNQRQKVKL